MGTRNDTLSASPKRADGDYGDSNIENVNNSGMIVLGSVRDIDSSSVGYDR